MGYPQAKAWPQPRAVVVGPALNSSASTPGGKGYGGKGGKGAGGKGPEALKPPALPPPAPSVGILPLDLHQLKVSPQGAVPALEPAQGASGATSRRRSLQWHSMVQFEKAAQRHLATPTCARPRWVWQGGFLGQFCHSEVDPRLWQAAGIGGGGQSCL